MAYCALADLQVLLDTPTLVDLSDGSGTTPDSTVISGVIARADSVIDAMLGKLFAVPFSTVPAVVKTISAELAIYFLYGRHHDRTAPEAVKARYDNAKGLLEKIAAGEVSLGVSATASSLGPSIGYLEPYDENKFDMNCLEPSGSSDPEFIDKDDDDE